MNVLEKKAIHIDQISFAKEVELYSNKIQAIQNINKVFNKYLPKFKIQDTFFDDAIENFYKALLNKYKKENTLNLKGEKLAELLEIDVSNLIRFNSVYLKLKYVSSPSIDTFTEYAETDEELSRLAACEKLIDVIKEIEDAAGVKAYPFDVVKAFRRILTFDVRKNTYAPSYQYIKDIKQRI